MNYEKSLDKKSKSDGGYDIFVLVSLNVSTFNIILLLSDLL